MRAISLFCCLALGTLPSFALDPVKVKIETDHPEAWWDAAGGTGVRDGEPFFVFSGQGEVTAFAQGDWSGNARAFEVDARGLLSREDDIVHLYDLGPIAGGNNATATFYTGSPTGFTTGTHVSAPNGEAIEVVRLRRESEPPFFRSVLYRWRSSTSGKVIYAEYDIATRTATALFAANLPETMTLMFAPSPDLTHPTLVYRDLTSRDDTAPNPIYFVSLSEEAQPLWARKLTLDFENLSSAQKHNIHVQVYPQADGSFVIEADSSRQRFTWSDGFPTTFLEDCEFVLGKTSTSGAVSWMKTLPERSRSPYSPYLRVHGIGPTVTAYKIDPTSGEVAQSTETTLTIRSVFGVGGTVQFPVDGVGALFVSSPFDTGTKALVFDEDAQLRETFAIDLPDRLVPFLGLPPSVRLNSNGISWTTTGAVTAGTIELHAGVAPLGEADSCNLFTPLELETAPADLQTTPYTTYTWESIVLPIEPTTENLVVTPLTEFPALREVPITVTSECYVYEEPPPVPDHFAATIIHRNRVRVSWPTEPGKRYRLFRTTNLQEEEYLGVVSGWFESVIEHFPLTGERAFWRFEDADSFFPTD